MDHLRNGTDTTRSTKERAESLWAAAQIARHTGVELLASALDPDWESLGANFQMDSPSKFRAGPRAGPLTRSKPDEQTRVRRSRIEPDRRWHYRYVAADLAWRAAELMPDNSSETARVLAEAGSWIKTSAPQEADRFYKALVRRCGNTRLGQEANRLHWFPSLPSTDQE